MLALLSLCLLKGKLASAPPGNPFESEFEVLSWIFVNFLLNLSEVVNDFVASSYSEFVGGIPCRRVLWGSVLLFDLEIDCESFGVFRPVMFARYFSCFLRLFELISRFLELVRSKSDRYRYLSVGVDQRFHSISLPFVVGIPWLSSRYRSTFPFKIASLS